MFNAPELHNYILVKSLTILTFPLQRLEKKQTKGMLI